MERNRSSNVVWRLCIAAMALAIVWGCATADAQTPGRDFVERTAGLDYEMVWLDGGAFQMGSPASSPLRDDDEYQHRVELDGFWIGRFEVTNAQYRTFLEESGYDGSSEADSDYLKHFVGNDPNSVGANRPIVWISWHNARAFAAWLSQRTGLSYDLPTEAQWEYACRAGTNTEWSWGDSERQIDRYAWYAGNTNMYTRPIGQLAANPWGLHDMHGNADEWVIDWYDPNYYRTSATRNPMGPNYGDMRIARGGGINDNEPRALRSSYRYPASPDFTLDSFSMRLVCTSGGSGPVSTGGGSSQDYVESTGGTNLEMVWVEGGSFDMGTAPGAWGRDEDETLHRVDLDGFWIGRYEVTNAQYRAFVNASGYDGSRDADADYLDHWRRGFGADNEPVIWVSWNNARAFCDWLSRQTGHSYDLPTEAQWEYACRAGTSTAFSFGESSSNLGEYGWSAVNSGGHVHPVGQLLPNPLGLYDMHGNVEEWCYDWYDYDYYASSPRSNPAGPSSGTDRVLRGGGIGDEEPNYLRSYYRWYSTPDMTMDRYGFRVMRRR